MRTLLVPPDDILAALKTSALVPLLNQTPDSTLDVLCSEPIKALFECMMGVQTVYDYSGENHLSVLRSQLKLARSLRSQGYDRTVVLKPQKRWPALALAMGTKVVPSPAWVETNTTVLHAPNVDSRYVRRKFGVSALMPMILFHSQLNYWPTRYWVELINLLSDSGPYQAVFIGNASQRSMATEVCAISNLAVPTHNLCGLASLRDNLGLIACAKIVVGSLATQHQLSIALGTKALDMKRAPLTAEATPRDLAQAIEQTLAGDRNSDNTSGSASHLA
jgi:ADP-heptose:LPS heptosyltransferase